MEWSKLPWCPTRRLLRQFSILWLALVAVPAAWKASWSELDDAAIAFAAVASLAGAAGVRWPLAIRPLWVLLLAATFPAGWLVSRIVMVLLYFMILTPVGLILRWRGHDPLQLRDAETRQATFWKERPLMTPPAQYLKTYRLFS